jgi:hypothetical protein
VKVLKISLCTVRQRGRFVRLWKHWENGVDQIILPEHESDKQVSLSLPQVIFMKNTYLKEFPETCILFVSE